MFTKQTPFVVLGTAFALAIVATVAVVVTKPGPQIPEPLEAFLETSEGNGLRCELDEASFVGETQVRCLHVGSEWELDARATINGDATIYIWSWWPAGEQTTDGYPAEAIRNTVKPWAPQLSDNPETVEVWIDELPIGTSDSATIGTLEEGGNLWRYSVLLGGSPSVSVATPYDPQ